jgi:plasmid stabilization system protein ParE
MPRQGTLPHDLVHYVVESGLGWPHGFLAQVAAGRDLSSLAEYLHDPNNREATDQAIQVEALVESLQAQLWSGAFDREMFMEGLRGACSVRGRDVPDLTGIDLEQVLYRRALELGARWQQVPFYGSLEVELEHA